MISSLLHLVEGFQRQTQHGIVILCGDFNCCCLENWTQGHWLALMHVTHLFIKSISSSWDRWKWQFLQPFQLTQQAERTHQPQKPSQCQACANNSYQPASLCDDECASSTDTNTLEILFAVTWLNLFIGSHRGITNITQLQRRMTGRMPRPE